jgi:phage anti-repressor protein
MRDCGKSRNNGSFAKPVVAKVEPVVVCEAVVQVFETDGGRKAVSARELYGKLGYDSTHWKRWYAKNIEKNPFALQNKDWAYLPPKESSLALMANERGKFAIDFALTIDFAKKLSMMARTEAGEKVRDYFIRVEKELHEGSKFLTVWEYCKLHKVSLAIGDTSAKSTLMKDICKERGISIMLVPHAKYGFIHAYPAEIIKLALEI